MHKDYTLECISIACMAIMGLWGGEVHPQLGNAYDCKVKNIWLEHCISPCVSECEGFLNSPILEVWVDGKGGLCIRAIPWAPLSNILA